MQVRGQELDDAQVVLFIEAFWAFMDTTLEGGPIMARRLFSDRSPMGSEWHAVVNQARRLFNLLETETGAE